MRTYRYSNKNYISNFFRRIFNKYTAKYWIVAAAIALVIVVFAIVTATRPVTAEQTGFYSKDIIRIGIGIDNPSFASLDENGSPQGFERDLAELVFGELYPEAELEFMEIEEQQASYLLRNGEIDVALCMLAADVLKSQGLALSDGYFTDGIYAFVTADGGVTGLNGLQGRTVGVMASEVPASLVTDYLEEQGLEVDVMEYASYPDAIDALEAGRISAIFTTRYKMAQHGEGLLMIDQPVSTLTYRMAFWTDNTSTRTLVNQKLAELREDGRLEALIGQYGLAEITQEEE